MKFRDPKTGEVFENIEAAMNCFCYESLRPCNKCDFNSKNCGKTWVHDHPVVAARLMGYEVLFDDKEIANKKAHWIDNADSYICSACGHEVDNPNKQTCGAGQCMFCGAYMETKEDNMNKQDKPRLAEVLGVEVGQKWRVVCPEEDINSVEVWLNEKGHLIGETLVAGSVILCAAINHPESIIRAPRLTEPEIAIMRAVGAKWVSRDDNCDDGSVDLWGAKPLYGDGMYNNTEDGGLIATIRSSALSHLSSRGT